MKRLYTFHFNKRGNHISIKVVSGNLSDAEIVACNHCAANVSSEFESEALNGEYLTNIEVEHGIHEV